MLDRGTRRLRGTKAPQGRQGFHPLPPGADAREIRIHGLRFRRKAESVDDRQQVKICQGELRAEQTFLPVGQLALHDLQTDFDLWQCMRHDLRGKTRAALDAMLREVASRGPWVSAHPDVILKMGVKEVLHRTKHLGWGADTHLYRNAVEFHADFPTRLQSAGPRVLKQNRGNDGQGVWKVELVSQPGRKASVVRILQALRGSMPEELPLAAFMTRCEAYFTGDGCIVDQPFQPRLPDGMIRCYMGADKVVGFGHQFITALIPPPPEGPDSPPAQPGPRICITPTQRNFRRSGPRWKTTGRPR